MFKNYFITGMRHIRKSKVIFAFKLGGLSLAIFSFLSIATMYRIKHRMTHIIMTMKISIG